MNITAKYIILMPCYNDWQSASNIINTFHASIFSKEFTFIVVNDFDEKAYLNTTPKVHFLHLNQNKGHQAAIAIGLAYCSEHFQFEKIIVMDSDEQDNPDDVISALENEAVNKVDIVFFKREKRQENYSFKIFYRVYLFITRLLTGHSLYSGNFTILSTKLVERITVLPSLYYHYNATLQLLKNKNSFTIKSNRLKRNNGKSSMNFFALINHALNALTVMGNVIAVKLFFWSGILFIVSILGLITVLALKFFSDYTIYGWTSIISILLFIVLLFSLVLSTISLLLHKASKWNVRENPKETYKNFISKIEYV